MTVPVFTAEAQLLDFDDLDGLAEPVPDGYGGFAWNNFLAVDSTLAGQSGFAEAAVSGRNSIAGAFGSPTSFTSANAFTLDSLYLTAGWNDGLTIEITGRLGFDALFATTVVVNTSAPTFFSFNWAGIDTVTFVSSGGIHNPDLPGTGTHFALDDLSISPVSFQPVPEPATYGLAAALALGAFIVRHRRRAGQNSRIRPALPPTGTTLG